MQIPMKKLRTPAGQRCTGGPLKMALSAERTAIVIAATMGLSFVADPAAAYTVYISNEKGNSITVSRLSSSLAI